MEYFPKFDETDNEEFENNNIVQNNGNGIIGLLSNFFRPSSFSNHRTIEVKQENQPGLPEKETNETVTDLEINSNSLFINGEIIDRQTLPHKTLPERNLLCYTKSEFRRYWMPDSSGTVCYECNEKFSTFRRRHHCRLCGQLFCKNCVNRTIDGKKFGYYGILRLCNYCAEHMENIQIQNKSRHVKDKLKLFVDIKSNGIFYNRDNRMKNDEVDLVSESTTGQAPQSYFYLQPSLTELGFNYAFNSTNQDASENLPISSEQNPINQNQQLLEQMFEEKLEKVFETLLMRENLCPKNWKFLIKLSRIIAGKITPLNLATSDAQNPLDFLHIKKIHIDVEPNYELINGVAFSKSLANSTMPISMKNVFLMLMNGTISYDRILEKFSSIEPIMQQEVQFLKNSCDRVLSAHISLLISENPIPIAFMDLLMREGISVITNVKKAVLKRISDATGADILNSLDAQFLQPRLGFLPDFCQREFYTITKRSKRIIYMENCTGGNFGLTVLINGKNMRELIAAKRILRFLVLTRYSSHLEIAFLSLFNTLPKNRAPGNDNAFCHICELNQRNFEKEENGSNEQNKNTVNVQPEFTSLFKQIQLTNSPAIHFSPPYSETPIGQKFSADFIKLREKKEEECSHFEALDWEKKKKIMQNSKKGHRMIDTKMERNFKKLFNENAWSNFRSTSAMNFRYKIELNRRAREERLVKLNDLLLESEKETGKLNRSNLDVLDPLNYQGIAFLFCTNSRRVQNAKEFCVGPYLFYRIFYDENKDVSLGKFLLDFCFNPEYKCSLKSCERPMLDHFRRIVHRNARIEITTHNVVGNNRNSTLLLGPFGTSSSTNILTNGTSMDAEFGGIFSIDELPSSIPNNNCQQMICWLRCNSCSANSSIVPMNDAVFHLSFAKFIDYLSNGMHWVSPFPSSIDFHQCMHCTFHTHSHFFAFGNYIACFRVSPIYPLNVIFNPIPCAIGKYQKEDEQLINSADIRDVLDAKGAFVVDVGSLIAHAFNSKEYSIKLAEAEQAEQNPTAIMPDFIEITYFDDKHQYTVKIYFAEQFKQFRSLIFSNGEKRYIHSLSTSSPWYPQGGKSGASFYRTDDERFVLKTLSRFELDSLKNCALKYINYVSEAALEHKLTCLSKIFGTYAISYTNKQNGLTIKHDYLVMEYLFFQKDIKQIWDLKGSLRNRLASTKSNNNLSSDNQSSTVLLDENYIQDLLQNQIYLTSRSKAALTQAIFNDSNFLESQGIMDYSLLAGISRGQEDEVIIGIVDYMRTFTLDKKVESLVKIAIPMSNSPTVISPESYRERFTKRIDGYFQVSPDRFLCQNG